MLKRICFIGEERRVIHVMYVTVMDGYFFSAKGTHWLEWWQTGHLLVLVYLRTWTTGGKHFILHLILHWLPGSFCLTGGQWPFDFFCCPGVDGDLQFLGSYHLNGCYIILVSCQAGNYFLYAANIDNGVLETNHPCLFAASLLSKTNESSAWPSYILSWRSRLFFMENTGQLY